MRVDDFPNHLMNKRVEVVTHDRMNNSSTREVGILGPSVYRSGRVSFTLENVETSRFDMLTLNVQDVDEINELIKQ